jgi:hypothetical protein
MSSSWPNCLAASAMAFAGWLLMARVGSNPKSSPDALRASTTPSETNVSHPLPRRLWFASINGIRQNHVDTVPVCVNIALALCADRFTLKEHVTKGLKAKFGGEVKPGSKAVKVRENGSRA